MKLVSTLLLPIYGWQHTRRSGEQSFRQTISTSVAGDRGFQVVINDQLRRIEVSFDANKVAPKHQAWLRSIAESAGLGEMNPQLYWGFDDLGYKAGTKLKNAFFVLADSKNQGGKEYFLYNGIIMLQTFSFDQFMTLLAQGFLYIDFDASTTHNHGTKFRIKQMILPSLYQTAETLLEEPLSKSEILKPIDVASLIPIALEIRAQDLAEAEREHDEENS